MLLHWLKQAVLAGASDLHLSAGRRPSLRHLGDIVPLAAALVTREEAQNMALQVLQWLGSAEEPAQGASLPRDCDGAFQLPELGRFRANLFQHADGHAMVLRLIPSKLPEQESLGLPEAVAAWLRHPQGLVLVTGPTGSGKSTTLACLVQQLNAQQHLHIVTLEDPIEYLHTSGECLIHQREIHRHTASFEQGLRSALREDPDILLVGELRDLSSIRWALTAAETGHLVLATLHTRGAAQTVSRLVDGFPGEEKNLVRHQLSQSLVGVLSQTLCKTLQGDARVAAFEVLVATPAVRHLIREDKIAQLHNTLQISAAQGMRTLAQDLSRLQTLGKISSASAHSAQVL
jgi:twitching motility protein PilT